MLRPTRLVSQLLISSVLGLAWLSPAVSEASAAPSACARAPISGQLNINTATADQWILLPGIGPATAAKIVGYRSKRPFTRLSQLMRVKGIGKKTFARLKPFLVLDGQTTLARGKISVPRA